MWEEARTKVCARRVELQIKMAALKVQVEMDSDIVVKQLIIKEDVRTHPAATNHIQVCRLLISSIGDCRIGHILGEGSRIHISDKLISIGLAVIVVVLNLVPIVFLREDRGTSLCSLLIFSFRYPMNDLELGYLPQFKIKIK